MDDAIKAFERAVQNGDSEGLAICQLSELYIETGRVIDGIQMLECNVQHVMQVHPQRWSAALRVAHVMRRCRTRSCPRPKICSA